MPPGFSEKTAQWIEWDKQHCWHPFTQQKTWCAVDHQPLILEKGQGVWLWDSEGKKYLDANSSIWTNIHGHNHPKLNASLIAQAQKVAHTSFLGFSNPKAAELAARLAELMPGLPRVFFSDDGSTAIECALRMEIQFRQQSNQPERVNLVAFKNAYHGDTMGAASLGGISIFFDRLKGFGFPCQHVANFEGLACLPAEQIAKTAAVIIEPMIQGVNDMRLWPPGILRKIRDWCTENGVHLICDEVMTGFGRTGKMFAIEHEQVVPDFLCLAKGLSGGYLPLAATLTTEEIYNGFLAAPEEMKAFFYGHSYTANQLGCAVALASLELFKEEKTLENVQARAEEMKSQLAELQSEIPEIFSCRQIGLIAGIELRQPNGQRFSTKEFVGAKACLALRDFGVLTRNVRDVIVLMPPLSIQKEELAFATSAIKKALSVFFRH